MVADWEKIRVVATSVGLETPWLLSEVVFYDELGELSRALPIVDDFVKRLPALTDDDPIGPRPNVLDVRHRAGHVPDADLRPQRDAWIAEATAKLPARWVNNLWFAYYGGNAHTSAEAHEALDALPRYTPLPPYKGDLGAEEVMGRVLLLAGRVDEAIPHLRSAASVCYGPDLMLPIHMHASEELGEALASQGDKDGACAAFAEVLTHLGHAKPRAVTADKAREHAKKLQCTLP
jgi:serine/threonine-protein kinase